MSLDSARIVCTGCDYETREVYRPIVIRYMTANGNAVETGRAKGWCFDCAGYADIKNIDPEVLGAALIAKECERAEADQRRIALSHGFVQRLRNRTERGNLRCGIRWLDDEIAVLRELLGIARNRRSKARCLRCWSASTASLSFDPQDDIARDFRHGCGGHLRIIHDHAGPRFFFRRKTYVLNEEGECLGEELENT